MTSVNNIPEQQNSCTQIRSR